MPGQRKDAVPGERGRGHPGVPVHVPKPEVPVQALALLLLWARGQATDAGAETADFAREWADQRGDRAVARERRQTEQPADPVAQARRLADRLALMDAGISDFARWLTDLVRTGLAAARNQPYAWWDGVAARLVDAQLPGLAEQVRAMGSDVHARADWADHLLFSAGRWWALTKAWAKRDEVSPNEFADLRAAVGWARASAEVQGTDALPGPWLVLGAYRSDDGQQQRNVSSSIDLLNVQLPIARVVGGREELEPVPPTNEFLCLEILAL
jgi:hypothetical protein